MGFREPSQDTYRLRQEAEFAHAALDYQSRGRLHLVFY